MIDFDCPLCGKHFSLSPKFAGRKFLCSGCKKEIVVPSEPQVTPPPAPAAVVAESDGGLDLLRHAFEDSQRDAQYQRTVPPPPPPKAVAPAAEPVAPRSYGILYLIAAVLAVVGVGVTVVLNLPESENPAVVEAENLRAEADVCLVASRQSETQSKTLWLKAEEEWKQAAAATLELFRATQESRRAEATLNEYRAVATNNVDAEKTHADAVALQDSVLKQLQALVAVAQQTEQESRTSDARIVEERNKSGTLKTRAVEVLHTAGLEPTPPVAFTPEEYERPRPIPTDDATEVPFEEIDFGEPRLVEFCPLIDTSRRLVGKKSWRLLAMATPRFSITFPKSRDAAWDVSELKKLSMALRFPVRNELPTGKLLPQTAQITSMSVSLGSAAGTIRYTCTSPRYFEILFFRGHGKFVPIDIPLTGNQLWTRSDDFDATQLANPDEPFLKRIDWVEVTVVPASPLTSLWIDDFKFSPHQPLPPINLRQEEELQQSERRKWAESLQ